MITRNIPSRGIVKMDAVSARVRDQIVIEESVSNGVPAVVDFESVPTAIADEVVVEPAVTASFPDRLAVRRRICVHDPGSAAAVDVYLLHVSLPVENNESICSARAVAFDSEVTDGYWLAGPRRVVRICLGGQHVTHVAILFEDGARGVVSGVSPVTEKDDPSGKQADTAPDFDDRSGRA